MRPDATEVEVSVAYDRRTNYSQDTLGSRSAFVGRRLDRNEQEIADDVAPTCVWTLKAYDILAFTLSLPPTPC